MELCSQSSNHYSVCRDLLRVSVFCKSGPDTQKMMGVMGLQIVDGTIILVLPSSGLYIMHELTKIKIPDCLNDLPKPVTDISDVFDRNCIPSVDCSHPKAHDEVIREKEKLRYEELKQQFEDLKKLLLKELELADVGRPGDSTEEKIRKLEVLNHNMKCFISTLQKNCISRQSRFAKRT